MAFTNSIVLFRPARSPYDSCHNCWSCSTASTILHGAVLEQVFSGHLGSVTGRDKSLTGQFPALDMKGGGGGGVWSVFGGCCHNWEAAAVHFCRNRVCMFALGAEQDQLPCEFTGTSSGNCQETETCIVRACYTPRQALQNHQSGHLGRWVTPWSAEKMLDGRHQ